MKHSKLMVVYCLMTLAPLAQADWVVRNPLPVMIGASNPKAGYGDPINDFSNGPKLYAGVSAGYSKQGDICNDPFFSGTCSNGDLNWKIMAGARFNPMFGAEISYNELGESSMSGSQNGNPATMTNEVKSINLAGMGYMPVTPQIEAFGKAGVAFWQRDSERTTPDTTTTIPNSKFITEQSNDKGQSPLLGVGAQFRMSPNVHVRGEWEHMFNVGSDSSYETDVDSYSLGLTYSTL